MKSFFQYTKEKAHAVVNIFIISGVLLLCFPAYGFIFPAQEITTFSSMVFSLFIVIVGFGFVGGAAIVELFSELFHMSQPTSLVGFQHSLTLGAVTAGFVCQIIYVYLIACMFVYFRHKHQKSNAPQ